MSHGLPQLADTKIGTVLAQFSQLDKAVLGGSRARGNFKPGFDIDLTLFGTGLTRQHCGTIADALDDLLLPYTIDLSVFVDLHHPELEAHIQRVGVPLYQREG